MKKKIRIDVVSDVACPWCYIGKKNMEKAIREAVDYEFEVIWHPFQLDPGIPREGIEKDDYFNRKFGNNFTVDQMFSRVVEAGRKAGIHFRFDKMELIPNTFDMHKLIVASREEEQSGEVKSAFLKAYFEEGVQLNDTAVLMGIMESLGWSGEKVQRILSDEELSEKVRTEIDTFIKMGVNGVPFFIIHQQYALSGAQPPQVFRSAFDKIAIEAFG